MYKPKFEKRRTLFGILIPAPFLCIAAVFFCDRRIDNFSATFHTDVMDQVVPCEVALVLGCAETLSNGHINRYFTTRMDAAAQLYASGKCRYLIVSGDNGQKGYDEPSRMKAALVARGVAENAIYCDFAGFSTLDSIVRAARIFNQLKIIVVSQQFHNERAIYIARHKGITAQGFNAASVGTFAGLRTRIRESGARVKTLFDIHILKTGPRFLGPEIHIGGVPLPDH